MDCGDGVAGLLPVTVSLSVVQGEDDGLWGLGSRVAAYHCVSLCDSVWGRGDCVSFCLSVIQGEDDELWGRGGRVAVCHSVSLIQGEDGGLWGRGGRVAVCHSVSLIQGEDGGLWGRGGRVAVPHAGEARVEAPPSAGRGLAAQQAEGPL